MDSAPDAGGPTTPAGWYPDPHDPAAATRWWDGSAWSPHLGPAPAFAGEQTAGSGPSLQIPYGPTPAPVAPATGFAALYHLNRITAATLVLCAVYLVIGAATHLVLFGIAPVLFTVRAFQRKGPLAAVAAAASVLAVVAGLAGI